MKHNLSGGMKMGLLTKYFIIVFIMFFFAAFLWLLFDSTPDFLPDYGCNHTMLKECTHYYIRLK